MKEIIVTTYQCEKCLTQYKNEKEALQCEAEPITQDKGVKVGDIVIITQGDGTGSKAKVTKTWIIDRDWGHYAWEKYWHTVAISADIIGSYGSRMLTFDSYKPISSKTA